jgi:cytochrome b subunit of formate dehydrogenase
MTAQNERFVRWQKISIEHLGFCNNLILALATGAFAYSLSLTQDKTFEAARTVHWYLGAVVFIALLALSLSMASGLFCMLNRLRDFRGTSQRAKESPNAPSKEELDQMGKLTWNLFYGQAWAFIIALAFLGTAVWRTFVVGLISTCLLTMSISN